MPEAAIFEMGSGEGRREETLREAFTVHSRHGVAPPLRLLIEALPVKAPKNALLGHESEGVCAAAARWLWPDAPLAIHEIDAYVAAKIARGLARNGYPDFEPLVTGELPDAPDGEGWALIALAQPAQQEAQLRRDWIEQAHDRLMPGGRFLISSRPDQKLRAEVAKIFGKAELQASERGKGVVICAHRSREDTRERPRRHLITVDHRGREFDVQTRPGVFVYGRLDPGARALLSRLQTEEGERVCDLGCGTGLLGIAAALDSGDPAPVLVDSNARAVDLAHHNALRNGLEGARAVLRADAEDLPDAPYDLVLCNPPYFGDGRIARALIHAGARNLTPAGRLLLVAKDLHRHGELLEEAFERVNHRRTGGYTVFEARRPRPL